MRRTRRTIFNIARLDYRCYTDGPGGATVDVKGEFRGRTEVAGDIGPDSFVQIEETVPRIDFLVEDHVPERGNVYVLLFEGEPDWQNVFRVESVLPPDGLKITAICTELAGKAVQEFQG